MDQNETVKALNCFLYTREEKVELCQGLFTWSGGPRSSGVSFFCFHALGDTKQKKLTPLDRGPPLYVNRVLFSVILQIEVYSQKDLLCRTSHEVLAWRLDYSSRTVWRPFPIAFFFLFTEKVEFLRTFAVIFYCH